MKMGSAPISLAGSQLGEMRHVCAFFNNDEEEYRILLPFIEDGLKSGDKAVHVLNPEQRQDHLQRLTAAGINPAVAQQSGQLELWTNTEVFVPPEEFLREFRQRRASGSDLPGRPEIWMYSPAILHRKSPAFSAALMIWSAPSLFRLCGAVVSHPRLFILCSTRCFVCSNWISCMYG